MRKLLFASSVLAAAAIAISSAAAIDIGASVSGAASGALDGSSGRAGGSADVSASAGVSSGGPGNSAAAGGDASSVATGSGSGLETNLRSMASASTSGSAELAAIDQPASSVPTSSADGSGWIAPGAEVTALIGMPVVTSDGSKVGAVSGVAVQATGEPEAILAKIGGFIGVGGTNVTFPLSITVLAENQVLLQATKTQLDAFIKAGGDLEGAAANTTATADANAVVSAAGAIQLATPGDPAAR